MKTSLFMLTAVAVSVIATASLAQDLPQHPSYVFNSKFSGNTGLATMTSDTNGSLSAQSHRHGYFHDFKLTSLWDKKQLSFNYACTFANNSNQSIITQFYNDGEDCPSLGATESQYIEGVRIKLSGPLADKYALEYECWIGHDGRKAITPLGRVKQGEVCGHEASGLPAGGYVSKIQIYLSRK